MKRFLLSILVNFKQFIFIFRNNKGYGLMFPNHIRIGTRSSPLALKQAQEVKEALLTVLRSKRITVEIVPMSTSGDKHPNVKLSEIGGKGLFTKELEHALKKGVIDLAVHSMKDVETWLSPDFSIPSMLCREDPRDSWISVQGHTLLTLPPGNCVGTSSLRRAAQILHLRPDLRVIPFRGNIDTRLNKLYAEKADATLLAVAGLRRLQRDQVPFIILDPDVMVPAAGQGALGIECLSDRQDMVELLASINHSETYLCVALERAFLEEIDGSCGTPVGCLATLQDKLELILIGCVATPDGKYLYRQQIKCLIETAEGEVRNLGKQMSQWLKDHQ
jgi:hydroxymethylbilane synthase